MYTNSLASGGRGNKAALHKLGLYSSPLKEYGVGRFLRSYWQ